MRNNLKQSFIMTKTKMMFFLFLGALASVAQAQQSINAAGGDGIGSEGTVSFSVGQIDYTCNVGTGGSVTQGVQQFDEVIKILSNDEINMNVEMVIYPNPTIDLVNLKIENYDLDNLSYALFDLQGRQIAINKITQNETQIQMNNLASAVYLLNVFDKNQNLKTFKIIKKN